MFKNHKLDFLIALYIFCIAASEMMGGKTFAIMDIGSFHLTASVGIFFIPLVYSANDVITEVYGPERTRSIIRSGLIMIALVIFFSVLATSLPPSDRFAPTEPAYDAIFSQSARIAFASLIAFALAEFLDVIIYVRVRRRFGTGRLWLRNNVSNFFSELTDTGVFITLAFYALDKPLDYNVPFLLGLIVPYWLLKCFMSIIETPFVYLGVRWLRADLPAETPAQPIADVSLNPGGD